jgi:hypothetical protein
MTRKEMKSILERWIKLLDQSGNGTKQQVLEEMKKVKENVLEKTASNTRSDFQKRRQ